MILRRINRLLWFTGRNRTKSFTRCITVTFLLAVVLVHIQIQVSGNFSWGKNRGRPFRRRTGLEQGEEGGGETFAWYGVHEGKEEDTELFYIDDTNIDDEKPIPPPVGLGGPHRLILGKKSLLSTDDSFRKVFETEEEDDIFATVKDPDVSNTGLKLQPWASDEHSLDAEASRFLKYITVPQKECKASKLVGCPKSGCPTNWPLNICFNEIAKRQKCIVYSFRTSFPTLDFENEMADAGCEVHVFDPTQRSMRYEPLAQRPAEDVQRNLVFHRITLDWRETVSEFEIFGPPSLRAKNLRTVMAELGHHTVEVLRADLESSEWKLIENLLQDRWINRINQLILNVHLHWSGFEVSGAKPDVVRFWYSVIFGLGSSDFHLFNSVAHLNAPQIFLGETGKFNASSSYTLAFMRNL